MAKVKSFCNSLFESRSYLLECDTCLVDCGDWNEGYSNIQIVLLTHAHFDHIYGLNKVIEMNPDVKIFTNQYGKEMLLDSKKNLSRYHETPFVVSNPENIEIVEDGQEVEFGEGISAKAIFTPGHNPSCITWEIGDMLFTGDAYIPGIKVVTNLPGSNKKDAEKSLELIMKLAENHVIYPGHQIEEQ